MKNTLRAQETSSSVEEETNENVLGKYPLTFPIQRIIHGCPGSGKSYRLHIDAKEAHYLVRTVFHPETTYSDFVGGLRPQSIYKLEERPSVFVGSTSKVPGEPFVQYVVQTGPLLKAYQLACMFPLKSVVLIIEEISRAMAANVFGDMLQLLDREQDSKGKLYNYSSYEIEPRPDISSWLATNEVWHDASSDGCIRFPPNLYIWATMNRADQNAKQLDSAFLRRWRKEYISYLESGPIDQLETVYGGKTVTWGYLRKAINSRLSELGGVSEDKFLGAYFLQPDSLNAPSVIYEDLWGYLWNDVLKNRAPTLFVGARTFAEVRRIWNNGTGLPIGEI